MEKVGKSCKQKLHQALIKVVKFTEKFGKDDFESFNDLQRVK